jgi:hypothetical protein
MSQLTEVSMERFLSKWTVAESGCWEWAKPKKNGYGYFYLDGKELCAHRVSYTTAVGPIPHGLVLDHLCENPRCINPDHLEPVTQGENVARGGFYAARDAFNAARSACKHGHEFTPENTYHHPHGFRCCRTCQRDRDTERRIAKREAGTR